MSDDEDDVPLGGGARALKLLPYQSALQRADVVRVDQLGRKLAGLDDKLKLWVKDSTEVEGGGPPRESFLISATPGMSVADVRRAIIAERERRGVLTPAEPLKLVFSGRLMDDALRLDDYPLARERGRWSRPYAGVIWIVPFFLVPTHSVTWGADV